jgi:hypothetical protein
VAENFREIQRRATKKVPFAYQDLRAMPSQALRNGDYVELGG